MIVRLTGTVLEVSEEAAVIERDGIAREVLVPRYAIGELAACIGRQVTLFTLEFLEGNSAAGGALVPRLLGFVHEQDRSFFKKFISVKGIGPRKALKALAEPVVRVARWIEKSDMKSLAGLPGIGKRAADLIVAELRGKLDAFAMGGDHEVPPAARLNNTQRDALEVLLAWGDSRPDAERWIERAAQLHPDIDSADEWVRAAYKIKSGVDS